MFATLDREVWRIDGSVDGARRERLLRKEHYSDIVRCLASSAVVAKAMRRIDFIPGYDRIEADLHVEPDALDAFHSACSGYRAQFYESESLGEAANKYAVQQLAPMVLAKLLIEPRDDAVRAWLTKSAFGDDAKVWIHQGRWWRSPPKHERVLRPERWASHDISSHSKLDKKVRKRIRAGSLMPRESILHFKGMLVSASGHPFEGNHKGRSRSLELHMYGFT